MQDHVKQIIFFWSWMPKKVPLQPLHALLHSDVLPERNPQNISFRFGISFSATTTENALQSKTSSKGSTKLSAMITGTHS
ncbi:LOW QUALITY PROTEIN: uncharacterized protein LOC110093336 [Dendrobium catenatum]|uniref:LOW QUALITY PROTEIN: uncharacterized protein LOC110093336 n=1 Tax=Dendrobium catenatum TaxID=906689 RepID=UPI0010A0AF19|nr:LOW QUALITY PROTEIN: uncharacterized protein LOC110093336 [Dendrobium catenatum]